MRITRTPRANHFVQMANAAARDRQLSMRARGVLVFLLSLPDNWSIDSESIASETPREGRDAIRSALRELETAGYLQRRKFQNGRGHWVTECAVSDTPTEDGFPVVGYPTTGQPTVGTPGPKEEDGNEYPLTPNAAAVGEPCAKHRSLGRPHSRCRGCGTAGRRQCDRESPGRLSERCRAGDGRNCTADWCECPHHARRPS
jgi:hypothetical protein